MRRLDSMTPDELKEAALAVMQEEGEIEGWLVADRVARQLDGSLHDAESLAVRSLNYYNDAEAAKTRFSGRVRRVLDKLTDENLVIKVGARQTLPNGHSSGRFAVYYTPEAFGAARHARADRQAAAAELAARWGAINQRLITGAELELDSQHRLTSEQWEQLLDKAGWY